MPNKPSREKEVKGRKVRKRACMPKVRTGCLTCKSRRVKCDEAKPECRRCVNFGTTCEGYRPVQPNQVRSLLPRSFSQERLIPYSAFHGVIPFDNDIQRHYFRVFETETSISLAGFFVSNMWDRVILQASYDEAFVRDAAIAIGALTTSQNMKRQNVEESFGATADQHLKFALNQYEKAIQVMRQALMIEGQNPKKALIACLLVCCFEGLSGHRSTAISHSLSGHKLLQDWLKSHSHLRLESPGRSSPAPEMIEDELFQAYARLDLQLITFCGERPLEVRQALKNETRRMIDQMPELFSNIGEARIYWELIQRRISHFICLTPGSATRSYVEDEIRTSGDENSDTETSRSEPSVSRKPSVRIEPQFEQEWREYDQEIKRWRRAFNPLYGNVFQTTAPNFWTAADVLLAHSKMMEVSLACVLNITNFPLDNHSHAMQEIYILARSIMDAVKYSHESREFTFDLGVIISLHIVCKSNRDQVIYHEAHALLRALNFRDDVWDSLMIAEIDSHLVTLDSQGPGTGHMSSHSSLGMGGLEIGLSERLPSMEAMQPSEINQYFEGERQDSLQMPTQWSTADWSYVSGSQESTSLYGSPSWVHGQSKANSWVGEIDGMEGHFS